MAGAKERSTHEEGWGIPPDQDHLEIMFFVWLLRSEEVCAFIYSEDKTWYAIFRVSILREADV